MTETKGNVKNESLSVKTIFYNFYSCKVIGTWIFWADEQLENYKRHSNETLSLLRLPHYPQNPFTRVVLMKSVQIHARRCE